MRKYTMAISYVPKKEQVFNGMIMRTLRVSKDNRVHSNYNPNDEILLYEWQGVPRHSKWGRTKRVKIEESWNLLIDDEKIHFLDGEKIWFSIRWDDDDASVLALLDGIVPPTGEEWKKVILKLHGWKSFGPDGVYGKIISWNPKRPFVWTMVMPPENWMPKYYVINQKG